MKSESDSEIDDGIKLGNKLFADSDDEERKAHLKMLSSTKGKNNKD
jgi:hypothetical protein